MLKNLFGIIYLVDKSIVISSSPYFNSTSLSGTFAAHFLPADNTKSCKSLSAYPAKIIRARTKLQNNFYRDSFKTNPTYNTDNAMKSTAPG